MQVWRKGREFLHMLEHKQRVMHADIARAENQLSQLVLLITQHQQELAYINQQVKMLTPSGLVSQVDIYKGIREQGALLSHQQVVLNKISQLESEKFRVEQKLEQYYAAMKQLDKKHHKFTNYLQPLRRDFLRRRDNEAENEIQEIASYGKDH